MKKEYDVLKVYNSLFIFSTVYIFLLDLKTTQFNGSMPTELFSPSYEELIIGFFVHVIPLLLIFPIFMVTKDLHVEYKQFPNKIWYFDEKKIHWFVCAIMLVNLIFSLYTGIGTADSANRNSVSYLLRIIPPEPLMLLYFVFAHNTKKKLLFWVNFAIYSVFELSTGWTGFILEYAFIELFMIVKHSKKAKQPFPILKFGLLCDVILVAVGGGLYSVLKPLKFAIRYGYSYAGRSTIIEGVKSLVSRLTDYEATVVSIINHNKIAQIYMRQGIWSWEAMSVFKNVLPRFIMPNKDYRILGNILMNSYYPDIESITSTGYSLPVYVLNLIESSLPGFVLWFFLYIILFIICKRIIQMFDNGNGDSDVLYFILAMTVFQGTPISVSIGSKYLELVYALVILPCLGIVKKKRRYLVL